MAATLHAPCYAIRLRDDAAAPVATSGRHAAMLMLIIYVELSAPLMPPMPHGYAPLFCRAIRVTVAMR